MALAVGVDPTAELGHPQLDPLVRELREDELELSAREGPLRLGDAADIPTGAAPSMCTLAVPLSSFVAACLATPRYPPATSHGATSRRTRAAAAPADDLGPIGTESGSDTQIVTKRGAPTPGSLV